MPNFAYVATDSVVQLVEYSKNVRTIEFEACLLYTSDAADE